MYTVPVCNIALNQQQAEIKKIVPERLSAAPTLQETLNKMMSRMAQMEITFSQMQANVSVPNFAVLSTAQSFFKPCCSLAEETISNSGNFKQDQISLHLRDLLPKDVGDLDNQGNFGPSSCQVVTVKWG